jgi:very-short-patch-repair endonuclease
VVELDGREYHENAFEADRERDATLLNAGFPVLRITWHRLTKQEQCEADRLQSLLDQRSSTPGPQA